MKDPEITWNEERRERKSGGQSCSYKGESLGGSLWFWTFFLSLERRVERVMLTFWVTFRKWLETCENREAKLIYSLDNWELVWAKRKPNQFLTSADFQCQQTWSHGQFSNSIIIGAKSRCETNIKIVDDEICDVVPKEWSRYDKNRASYEF